MELRRRLGFAINDDNFFTTILGVVVFLGRIGRSSGHSQMDDLHDLMTNILKN